MGEIDLANLSVEQIFKYAVLKLIEAGPWWIAMLLFGAAFLRFIWPWFRDDVTKWGKGYAERCYKAFRESIDQRQDELAADKEARAELQATHADDRETWVASMRELQRGRSEDREAFLGGLEKQAAVSGRLAESVEQLTQEVRAQTRELHGVAQRVEDAHGRLDTLTDEQRKLREQSIHPLTTAVSKLTQDLSRSSPILPPPPPPDGEGA